jgi:hypothetical protein
MKNILWLIVLLTNFSFAQGINEYPKSPLVDLTPGSLCDQPTRYRYPENIAYCERNVTTIRKAEIFEAYRRRGFILSPSQRSSYKIDHLIPLCAGGSNNNENLWPQHISVGQFTDDLERLGCEKMALGLLTQAKFIAMIKQAKNDVSEASEIRRELMELE